MQPEIDILGFSLKTFGLLFGLGFVAAGLILARRLNDLGKPVDWAYEIIFSGLVGGVVGSKLYYVAQNYDSDASLLGNVFSGSGLVWYGGAIGGAITVLLWARRRGMLNVGLLDLCAAPLAMGYAIGRVGCQVSGDGDYGKPWDGPWAMAYPDGAVPIDVPVHPTPIYEAIAMALVAWALWRSRDAFRPGIVFAFYLILSGLQRFLVEFLRRNDEAVLGLTVPQLQSLALVAAGALWLTVALRRGGLRRELGGPAARGGAGGRPSTATA